MKIKFACIILLFANIAQAQKLTKDENKTITSLKTNINYLADDKLEGRRTGTAGEKLAYEYIIKQLKKAGIKPLSADGNYLQEFPVNEGKKINAASLKINTVEYKLNTDFVPFAYSGKSYNTTYSRAMYKVYSLQVIKNENASNMHFDLNEKLYALAKDAEQGGAAAVFFIGDDELKFDEKDKAATLNIPVIMLKTANENLLVDRQTIECEIDIAAKQKMGHNIVSFINNNATHTIVLGAHYDHLGYGEDHNSLYAGATPMIHNGADDNASGTAALIEMGKWLVKSNFKKYNYLLLNFSGEELGLFGSKYFTEHSTLDLKTVNYMINMDMVGRLNDSTHGITIGGYGTSPTWGSLIKKDDAYLKINIDSSGSGPSDHTSFYKKDIPVLFFFTGSHKDYHKPSDDADKINFVGELKIINYIKNIIAQTNTLDKLSFTKTRETSTGKSSFKVSLGIMPDYTFTGVGVLVEGVSDNKPALKAGIKVGDVLLQLGDNKFTDVQTYMGALNKFNKGETTTVKILRGKNEILLPITF
jgi:aminopeptidase YwaD